MLLFLCHSAITAILTRRQFLMTMHGQLVPHDLIKQGLQLAGTIGTDRGPISDSSRKMLSKMRVFLQVLALWSLMMAVMKNRAKQVIFASGDVKALIQNDTRHLLP